MLDLEIVILAAGRGTRMRSKRAKILHELAGQPLVRWVAKTAQALCPQSITVVYGHGGDEIRAVLDDIPVHWAHQAERLGTGHALQQALPFIGRASQVLILYADVPLIQAKTLQAMVESSPGLGLCLLTTPLDDPSGYGRILRDGAGRVIGIVEDRDATSEQRAIQEVNTGILVLPTSPLKDWLASLDQQNTQGEQYLTDIVAMAVRSGCDVQTFQPEYLEEVMGVNDRLQLSTLERYWQRRWAENLMREGATVVDPARLDIRGNVRIGRDVHIDINVILEGDIVLEDEVRIGANNVLRDTHIGPRTQVHPNCVIEDTEIGENCRVGPFARLRPGTHLGAEAHIGNYVEVKKSRIGYGSKANHHTYIGDSDIGDHVNVGAGTITCNYDGVNKHKTVIGDNAFIGSGVELVAPVTVEAGATIGAGSTISKKTPAGKLTLERTRQTTVEGWKRPKKITEPSTG